MSVLHVVFSVADVDYIVPASDVLQMDSYSGATRVPGAAAHVAGIVHLRGRIVPVVDLRVRFGLPHSAPTLDSRIVVIEMLDRTVGVLVDRAREVVKLSPEELHPPPHALVDGAEGFVKAVAHVGKRMLMLVDFKKVIGEESVDVN